MRKLTPIFKDYIWGGTRLKTEYGKITDLPRVAESWELSDGPVLIKLIDARESLSVQVHPDDDYARIHDNGIGKTEMWVILDCEPG
ncbi:MAG: mannose-6-phosphate isomerase, partial [Oscillospiraceae bacterium]|nr:mannose-6-phosphate isomerase [Oscillospiraceae bacterium]